jgi:hypothetical protein
MNSRNHRGVQMRFFQRGLKWACQNLELSCTVGEFCRCKGIRLQRRDKEHKNFKTAENI